MRKSFIISSYTMKTNLNFMYTHHLYRFFTFKKILFIKLTLSLRSDNQ